jgi:hypothetical protein
MKTTESLCDMALLEADPLKALFAVLSDRARCALQGADAHFNDADRISPEALRQILRDRKMPELDPLFDLHEEVGGLAATGLSLTFAPGRHVSNLALETTPDGAAAVPVGYSAGCSYFIDARGILYRSAARQGVLLPVAESVRALLEKLALIAEVEPLRKGSLRLALRPRCGERIAAALGATHVKEATDRFHRFWTRGDLQIADGHPFHDKLSDNTVLFSPSIADVVAALSAARAEGDSIAARVDVAERALAIEPPSHAPPAPASNELKAVSALPLFPDEAGGGHIWLEGGETAIVQVREHNGVVLAQERIEGGRAAVRDFTSAVPELKKWLTERAVRGLARLHARRDPRRTASRDSLARLLRRWGLPAHAAALDFEERCGGLSFSDLRWGAFQIVDSWPNLPEEGSRSEDCDALVQIGESMRDNVKYYINKEGTVFFEDDTIEETPIAVSWSVCLERLGASSADKEEHPVTLHIRERAGQAIARALAVTPFDEGSDQYAAMWYREGLSILDEARDVYNEEPRTRITARSVDEIVEAMGAARELSPDAPMALFGVPIGAQQRSSDEAPVMRVRLWGDSWDKTERDLCVYGAPGRYSFVWT